MRSPRMGQMRCWMKFTHTARRFVPAIWMYETRSQMHESLEAPPHPDGPITDEELQVKFLPDSEENSLKY